MQIMHFHRLIKQNLNRNSCYGDLKFRLELVVIVDDYLLMTAVQKLRVEIKRFP